jgi:hypothetical protein
MMAMDACFRRAGSTGSTAARDGRRHGACAELRPFELRHSLYGFIFAAIVFHFDKS